LRSKQNIESEHRMANLLWHCADKNAIRQLKG